MRSGDIFEFEFLNDNGVPNGLKHDKNAGISSTGIIGIIMELGIILTESM